MVEKKNQAYDFERGVVPGHVTFFFSIVVVGNVDNWHRSMLIYRSFYVRVQDEAPYNDAEH